MVVLRSLVRVTGAVSVSAALICAGITAASAVPVSASPSVAGAPQAAAVDASAAAALAALLGAGRADTSQSEAFDAYRDAIAGLRRFGLEPFLYPSAAAFCHDGTTLGLVPAIAGAVPGPWPTTTVSVPDMDLSAVKSGQTMFAFVPYGLAPDGAGTSGMQVAWFNLDTGRGGLVPMGSLTQVASTMVPVQVPPQLRPLAQQAIQGFLASSLPMGGVRAVPVNTGQGTVLAAMFGSVRNGEHRCLFLPTVGVTVVH